MKIEIGESLMRSWLRHVRHCQVAELNWKPASSWRKFEDGQILMDQAKNYFNETLQLNVFKNTDNSSQLLRQAEVDVLGLKTDQSGRIENIYAVDIAYHEAGLNYPDTIVRVLKKLLRGRIAVQAYFGDVPCNLVFASPNVGISLIRTLQQSIDELALFFQGIELNTNIMLYANDLFAREILEPTLDSSADTADSSELFLRSYRLLHNFPSSKGEVSTGSVPGRVLPPPRDTLAPANREAFATDGAVDVDRIRRWAAKPGSKVHRIIALALEHSPVPRKWLVEEITRCGISDSAYGAVANLMTNAGNAYGRLFVEQGGHIFFHPEIEPVITQYQWTRMPSL